MLRLPVPVLAVTLIGFAAVHANAQDKAVLVGVATASCEEMNQLLELDPESAQRFFSGWLDGFLSGFNLAINLEVSKEKSIDLNTASFPDGSVRFQWLRAACRGHPERPLWAHATNLFAVIRSGR